LGLLDRVHRPINGYSHLTRFKPPNFSASFCPKLGLLDTLHRITVTHHKK